MKAKNLAKITIPVFFALIILNSIFSVQVLAEKDYVFEQCTLKVYANGYTIVSIVLRLTTTVTTVNVTLIGKPETDYSIIVIDENYSPLSYELKDEEIEIFALNVKKINITYVTASLTVKQEDTWYIQFNAPITATITLPKDALIVDLNVAPESIDTRNDMLVLTMPKGIVKIGYIIPPPYIPTPPQQNQTQTGEQPSQNQTSTIPQNQTASGGNQTSGPSAGSETEGTGSSPEQGGEYKEIIEQKNLFIEYFWLLSIIIGIVVIIMVVVLAKRRGEVEMEELRYEEVEIINALKALGGQAFQSDVAKLVDQPTTTLWRNIRRLAEKGYIKIEKRFGRNYLILKA